jgi:hypothetical protein
MNIQELVGLTKEEAITKLDKENVTYRVEEPGMCFTCDYKVSRVRVQLDARNVVVRVLRG